MFNIRIVKKTRPEFTGFLIKGEEAIPLYRCSKCGASIINEFLCCPYCKTELKWGNTFTEKVERIIDIKEILKYYFYVVNKFLKK